MEKYEEIINTFLSKRKYKNSFVNIIIRKEKFKTIGTTIGSDELLRDFIVFLKKQK